jgi:DNA-binding CsgD family transcriptional regulator
MRGAMVPDQLTPREREVLALLAEGSADGEIAQRLYISPKTASVHVANLKGKLSADSRVHLDLLARELLTPAESTRQDRAPVTLDP